MRTTLLRRPPKADVAKHYREQADLAADMAALERIIKLDKHALREAYLTLKTIRHAVQDPDALSMLDKTEGLLRARV